MMDAQARLSRVYRVSQEFKTPLDVAQSHTDFYQRSKFSRQNPGTAH